MALPALGLPAIKAKVDTGAKTSALHAHLIEPYGPPGDRRVRFLVHPAPGRDTLEVACEAPLKEYREVASSNGGRETRAVIETEIAIADRSWPIEITLTNRASMAYRMLLGRQALQPGLLVDPSVSFHQPRLSYRAYATAAGSSAGAAHRALSIAVLTRRPRSAAIARLEDAARRLGQHLDVLDVSGLEVALDGSGRLTRAGRALPHYDAVLPRVGAGKGAAFANACVRQLEAQGTLSLNPAEALERLRNPVLVAQLLDRVRLAPAAERVSDASSLRVSDAPSPRVSDAPLVRVSDGPAAGEMRETAAMLRCLVIGGHVAAVAEANGSELVACRAGGSGAVVKMARRAAMTLGLGLAAVDIDAGSGRVSGVSALPALAAFQTACGIDVAGQVLAEIEARVRGASPAVADVPA